MHLIKSGFQVGVISSGFKSEMVKARIELLKIPRFYVGREAKTVILDAWRKELGLQWNQIAFIGDDINDRDCMLQVGLAACPNNAVSAILKIADYRLEQNLEVLVLIVIQIINHFD